MRMLEALQREPSPLHDGTEPLSAAEKHQLAIGGAVTPSSVECSPVAQRACIARLAASEDPEPIHAGAGWIPGPRPRSVARGQTDRMEHGDRHLSGGAPPDGVSTAGRWGGLNKKLRADS
ncbi:hypothetical protein ON010_g5836 [Phytophthora cinnamomi]|nr:hypothetical protein ON010_g5836 [Phytophthora cinnamomi]